MSIAPSVPSVASARDYAATPRRLLGLSVFPSAEVSLRLLALPSLLISSLSLFRLWGFQRFRDGYDTPALAPSFAICCVSALRHLAVAVSAVCLFFFVTLLLVSVCRLLLSIAPSVPSVSSAVASTLA
jgi:hypothetical protein